MKEFHTKKFYEQSFVDFEIINIQLNHDLKEMSIELNGGYYENDKNILKCLRKVIISIQKWNSLEIKNDNMENKQHIFSMLHNICEFIFDKDRIILKGFLEDGAGWVEWTFTNPKVTIYGEIDESYSSDDG